VKNCCKLILTIVLLKCIRYSRWSQDGQRKKRGPIRVRGRRFSSFPTSLNLLLVISSFLYK